MENNTEERPLVSVGIIINGLVEQGFDRESLKVANNCLFLDTGNARIPIAEIYKGEVDLNDVAQWFNINP
jgi:hypothetical protein